MNPLLKEIRHNPLLWLLVFVPAIFACHKLKSESHTLLFALSVFAIVPLAALLSHATESVAAKTGDAVGGLLNATLGNLTELVARQRGPNRALRCTGAGAGELFHRAEVDGFAILAGCRGHDVDRHHHRRAGHQQRALGVVRREERR